VLEDTFPGDALDTTKWVVNSTPGGVQFIPPSEAGYLLTWTLPDEGFVLEYTEAMEEAAFWVSVPATVVPYAIGPGRRQANIPTSQLPASDQVFYRMVK
jgi:hypothetical protein